MLMWRQTNKNIAVVGHRGFCSDYPENTLPSFSAARDMKVDIIEFDVNITSDGELIVIHDNTLDRTTNGTGYSRDFPLEQLRRLDAGCHFKGKHRCPGVQIPTLREVMDLWMEADYKVIFNVEIKEKTTECADKVLAMLKEYDIADRLVIDCFDANIQRYIHSVDPKVKLQGFPGRLMQNFDTDIYDIIYGMGIPISARKVPIPEEQIRADVKLALDHGIDPWLYCADTEEQVELCIRCGATTITGNDIMPVINVLERKGLRMK